MSPGSSLHGGGFALLDGHDYNAYRLAHDLGIVVYSVDYRRSPPRAVPGRAQRNSRRVPRGGQALPHGGVGRFFGGRQPCDQHRAASRSRPNRAAAGCGLFIPAVDLRAIGDSYVANDGRDPLLTCGAATKLFAAYLGPPRPSRRRPHRFWPLPRRLRADHRRHRHSGPVAERQRALRAMLRAAGAPVHLRVWEGMWDAFETVPGLPEGEQVMREVFGFLDDHI